MKSEGVMDVGGGGREFLLSFSFFFSRAATAGGDTVPRTGEKITKLNAGGRKGATLEEVREALPPAAHALPERVRC